MFAFNYCTTMWIFLKIVLIIFIIYSIFVKPLMLNLKTFFVSQSMKWNTRTFNNITNNVHRERVPIEFCIAYYSHIFLSTQSSLIQRHQLNGHCWIIITQNQSFYCFKPLCALARICFEESEAILLKTFFHLLSVG